MLVAANEQHFAVFAVGNLVEPKFFALLIIINYVFFSIAASGVTSSILNAFGLSELFERRFAHTLTLFGFVAKFFRQDFDAQLVDHV